jgi:hypothetical protein
MSGPVTPMLVLGGISYANNWYNTGDAADVKPLLFAGIAAALLSLAADIPGFEPVATLLGWTALIAATIGPVQHPSPVQNLLKITGG